MEDPAALAPLFGPPLESAFEEQKLDGGSGDAGWPGDPPPKEGKAEVEQEAKGGRLRYGRCGFGVDVGDVETEQELKSIT